MPERTAARKGKRSQAALGLWLKLKTAGMSRRFSMAVPGKRPLYWQNRETSEVRVSTREGL